MSEPLYKIEEEGTNGWFLLENYENLTKERCSELWSYLLKKGYQFFTYGDFLIKFQYILYILTKKFQFQFF